MDIHRYIAFAPYASHCNAKAGIFTRQVFDPVDENRAMLDDQVFKWPRRDIRKDELVWRILDELQNQPPTFFGTLRNRVGNGFPRPEKIALPIRVFVVVDPCSYQCRGIRVLHHGAMCTGVFPFRIQFIC